MLVKSGDMEIMKLWKTFHLKFCKLLLKLKNDISSYMIYGELDRYPLDIY